MLAKVLTAFDARTCFKGGVNVTVKVALGLVHCNSPMIQYPPLFCEGWLWASTLLSSHDTIYPPPCRED